MRTLGNTGHDVFSVDTSVRMSMILACLPPLGVAVGSRLSRGRSGGIHNF